MVASCAGLGGEGSEARSGVTDGGKEPLALCRAHGPGAPRAGKGGRAPSQSRAECLGD